MEIQIKVNTVFGRVAVILAGLLIAILLSLPAGSNLIAGVLSDARVDVRPDLIAAGIKYVPNSAAVSARLVEAQMTEGDRDLTATDVLARRTVNLSPWDYRNRLLLATVKEAAGDRAAAEAALQEALSLAPNYTDVHWRFANLLLREGKLAKAVPEFRIAASSSPNLLPATLDLLWRVSGGNLAVAQAVTPKDAKARLVLAQFLLNQSRASDAITVFAGIDRGSLVGLPESSAFIDALIKAGNLGEARGLWIGLVSGEYAQPGRPLPAVWNGGFETEISKSLGQFDWMISRNEYAVPAIDQTTSHTGSRSLRIDFAGRDTTKLDGQIKQTISVRPGAHYVLECYTKTERLESPEGPRIVVADIASATEVAASSPLATGSTDWRRIALEFTAPAAARAVVITIKRVPKYSYDDPTRGTIWFDDFVLTEQLK
ncbi:MAG TPA: tetratricopeptide repeat protein [Blastocatellia bacterium]|nr:tetratricopeptide repeat protein [Blastocatellia bacterium]